MKNLYLVTVLLSIVSLGCKKSDSGNIEVLPLSPTSLTATVINSTLVELEWKDGSTNEKGFVLQRKLHNGIFSEIARTAADVTTFSDKTVQPNNSYTYRVLAFNSAGSSLSYTNEVTVTTNELPLVTTSVVTKITGFTAECGGGISNPGNSNIISKGVVWSTAPNPTVLLTTKTNDGQGVLAFTSTLSNLIPNTKYYVKAYATTDIGTVYGSEVSFITSDINIKAGLIAYYPFNGNAGDSSGNDNHASTTGSVNFVNDRNLRNNGAAQLGTGYFTSNTNFFRFTYDQQFSVAYWFTLETNNFGARLLSTENPEGNFRVTTYGNGQYALQFGDAANYIYQNVPLNTWQHVVYVFDKRVVKVYINGSLVLTTTNNTTEALRYGSPFTIGAKAAPAYDKWQGKIDELRIYNKALTADEVRTIHLFN